MVQTGRGRYRGKYLGRGTAMPADPPKRKPRTIEFTCPQCERVETTKYEYCFSISACGWFLAVEPQPTWGHVDGGWTVKVLPVRRVAPDNWEEAKCWGSVGEPRRRPCLSCTRTTMQTPRSAPEVVTTCDDCGTAHPDDFLTREATLAAIEDWKRRGLVTEVLGDDGKPRGVKFPTFEDVTDDAAIADMLGRRQAHG